MFSARKKFYIGRVRDINLEEHDAVRVYTDSDSFEMYYPEESWNNRSEYHLLPIFALSIFTIKMIYKWSHSRNPLTPTPEGNKKQFA